MSDMLLAAWLNAYRSDLRDALSRAAGDGFRAADTAIGRGFLEPADFGASAQRHLRKTLRDMGLRLDGVAVLTPGAGLADPQHASERMDRLRETVALGTALGVPRVTVNLSGFDDPRQGPLATELLAAVAELSDRFGVQIAVHDPLAPPDQTAARLSALGCPTMSLALDTARQVGPAQAADVVRMTGALHLRDVRRRQDGFEETAFGEGDVDFREWLAGLAAADRPPALVVRSDGARGVDALRQGREYIERIRAGAAPRG